jgi:hypothetical protein
MQNKIPQLSDKELQKFGFILSGLLIAVFGALLPYLWKLSKLPNYYWITLGILVAIWALVNPASMRGFYNAWMRVAMAIGNVVNSVVLAVVYFLAITPMAIVMLIIGKDPMNRKWDKAAKSYRKLSSVPPKKHFERPF